MTITNRLIRREGRPALLRLHRALSRLTSVVTVMNTGAHPDDEQSGMLAWFRFGLGMRVVVACSTRGEGGQNILGPDRGGLLGVLRSREMEEAARVLDCDVAWLGFGPSDPVHDFGFSKDGDATFARWGGEAVITERLARAYRQYRPDVVIPTFLDVPGQHGHHRAMTRAAQAALALAADPAALGNDPAWQVSHYYLPAWSGGGGTYDDALPPPPATLHVRAEGVDPATGAAFDEIGEWSRRRHASQGMGHWRDPWRQDWALHLVEGGAEARLAEGIPQTLADLVPLAGPAGPDLAEAAGAIAGALRSFPDGRVVLGHLAQADAAIERADRALPPEFRVAHGHRLTRKRREIAVALAEAAGLDLLATVEPARLTPGQAATIRLPQSNWALTATPHLPTGVALTGTDGPVLSLTAAADAPVTPTFLAGFDPLGGNGVAWVEMTGQIGGRTIALNVDLETPLEVRPAATFDARPDAFVRRPGDPSPLVVRLTSRPADLALDAPPGWSTQVDGAEVTLTPPVVSEPGLATITPLVGGQPALTETRGRQPHVGAYGWLAPAAIRVLSVDLALPEGAQVAYIGAGDSVGRWMDHIGLDVAVLDALAPDEDFAAYTTVVIGVVAFGSRPDLPAAVPALHRFVRRGGHLLTLYQRPDQGWDAQTTPPAMLRIGTPSLRWRCTDPTAAVRMLAPSHPLLAQPNRIRAADFEGWDKERGLYFAAEWDPAYRPLLEMADAGEAPLTGALVSGRIGAGRHTHVALVLHHQLDRLVPGAFRLLANLVQPAA